MLAEKQKPKMLNGGRRNVGFLTKNYTKENNGTDERRSIAARNNA